MPSEHEVDLMKLFRVCGKYFRTTYDIIRGFEFAMLRRFHVCYAMLSLSAARPSNYRGHRATGTIAASTVTSAVTDNDGAHSENERFTPFVFSICVEMDHAFVTFDGAAGRVMLLLEDSECISTGKGVEGRVCHH